MKGRIIWEAVFGCGVTHTKKRKKRKKIGGELFSFPNSNFFCSFECHELKCPSNPKIKCKIVSCVFQLLLVPQGCSCCECGVLKKQRKCVRSRPSPCEFETEKKLPSLLWKRMESAALWQNRYAIYPPFIYISTIKSLFCVCNSSTNRQSRWKVWQMSILQLNLIFLFELNGYFRITKT